MPDLLCGNEGWDAVLAHMIEKSGGAVWDDLVYHEKHNSFWEASSNRYSVPSQKHNRELAHKYFLQEGVDPKIHGL